MPPTETRASSSAARHDVIGTAGTRAPVSLSGGSDLPPATVARLPVYLRELNLLSRTGVEVVSSGALAEAVGVAPAQLRKDLSHLGSYGTRGVGYDVAVLQAPARPRDGLGARVAGGHRRASATWVGPWPATPASPAAASGSSLWSTRTLT